MEFNSLSRVFDEIIDRTLEGNEAVYWKSDGTDDQGNSILQIKGEPVQAGFQLRIGINVSEEHANAGIPQVIEKSEYAGRISEDWYYVNSKLVELNQTVTPKTTQLQFEKYDAGLAWYTQEFHIQTTVQKLKSKLGF